MINKNDFIKLNNEDFYQRKFTEACQEGDVELVKSLFTNKNFVGRVNYLPGLNWACNNGYLDIVKFLLKNNTNLNKEVGFVFACEEGRLDVIKYLLTSPELKEHADIHTQNDEGFIYACKNNHLEIIKYFIFDMNIEKTEFIEKCLKENKNEQIENMLKLRELNEFLNNELKSDKINNKKVKL